MEAGMIRILTLALTGGMVLFAACGGSGDDDNSDATPQATVQATPEATAVATPPWAGQQADLKTNLGQMVLTKEDLPGSLNWLDPVENPPEVLKPIIAPERDPLTMVGLPWRPGSSGPLRDSASAASAFVGREGDVWLWSFVSLPADLDTLSAVRRAMIQANGLDVAQLRLDLWDSFTKEELNFRPESVRIGGAQGLGEARFSYGFSLYGNVEADELYQVQGYAFNRGPVFAVLMVVCKPGTLGKDDGIYLALTLDDKIQETLTSLGLPEA
jgi:hypothetical protein